MEFLQSLMSEVWMGKAIGLWVIFFTVVTALIVLDLGVLHRKQHVIGVRESLKFSLGYILVSCLFGAWVWNNQGMHQGITYYTGYLVELSLSMDNLFVISLIFAYFKVPREYQHRVLFWGIIGAIVMRGVTIMFGIALIERAEWILYIFGAFLIYSGIKIIKSGDDDDMDLEHNKLLKFLKNHMRVTHKLEGQKFFVRHKDQATGNLVRFATPLFLALVMIEVADLVFAVDSIPAILAITTDPYIVFTSNIFAIMGLRSLYFALIAVLHKFEMLKNFLAVILIFIGGKIFYDHFVGDINPLVSLGITVGLLAAGVITSLVMDKRKAH